jgi:hypothetical protein
MDGRLSQTAAAFGRLRSQSSHSPRPAPYETARNSDLSPHYAHNYRREREQTRLVLQLTPNKLAKKLLGCCETGNFSTVLTSFRH